MRKTLTGIIVGAIAGIIDVIPMILQHLTWDANISAFLMWVITGFFTANLELKLPPFLKGIIIAFLVLLPSAILIGSIEAESLIPISIMTIILGGLLGYSIDSILKKETKKTGN